MMNKKLVVGLAVLMLLNVTIMIIGFSYLQIEINHLKKEESELSTTSALNELPPEQTEPESTETTKQEPPTQEPIEPKSTEPEQTTNSDNREESSFVVYRWWNGNVTRNMLDKYAAWRMIAAHPLLFTYRLNSTYGMAAYYIWGGQGFETISEYFEADLTRVTERWTKTVETARIRKLPYGTTPVDLQYAHLFP